jgi:hypothetical protein
MPHNRLVLRAATWVPILWAVIAATVACSRDETAVGTGTQSPGSGTTTSTAASPSASASSAPARCSGGWKVPQQGTELATFPIELIREMSHHAGSFKIVELRYFVGVESPPNPDKPYLKDIERWYVKLYDPRDQSFRGRFLVERRLFGSGVVAIAPFDTDGFSSPDWLGLSYEVTTSRPRELPGLPGKWSGTTYDFVAGGNGINLPGLPAEEAGCLNGT